MRYQTVFLDRDGVINRQRSDYVKSWDEFELLPGAIDAIGRLSGTGRDVIILTNQSAIGRGLVTRKTVDGVHERLSALVTARGGQIKAFLVCPHAPEEACTCRKPAPGLFIRAEQELSVDLSAAVMIGDQVSDVEAATAAGCESILVDPLRELKLPHELACTVVKSLTEAVQVICAR